MAVPRGITLQVVEREPERLPFVLPLLQRWMDLEFSPADCRRAVEEAFRDPHSGALEPLLDVAAIADGGMVAQPALLFPEAAYALRVRDFGLQGSGWEYTAAFDADAGPDVAALLRRLTGSTAGAPDPWMELLPTELQARLQRCAQADDGSAPAGFPALDEPGLYRREHGCVVVRSRTTSLMLDPVHHWMPHAPRARCVDRDGRGVDAIFVTHGHADHFNVASILAQAGSGDPLVVVPPVPRTSLLAPHDMLGTLRLLGVRAQAPAWGSSLTVGDIVVDVLPFYGEQPVREGEGAAPGLRNWGSCYRFTTPAFSAIAIIDSGVDPQGDMAEVLRASVDRQGPVDFVLSSLPRFHCPFFLGLPHYYLSLSFARLRELHRQYRAGTLPTVTPGPDGIVEICRAAQPRWYLPYGNGFDGVGAPISDVGMHIGEPSEPTVMRYLGDRLAAERIPTVALPWNPGDRIALRGGRASRVAHGA